jgi:MoxR-like ATPase
VLGLQAAVREVYVDILVQEYIVKLVDSTRHHQSVYLGGSPRGSLALQRLAQARAIMDGREYVLPDDAKRLAYPVLAHRMILNAQARVKGVTERQVIQECADRIPVPGVRATRGS